MRRVCLLWADRPALKYLGGRDPQLLYNDIDHGVEVPSDWWLRLAGAAGASLHSGTPLVADMPCCPSCKCPKGPDITAAESV